MTRNLTSILGELWAMTIDEIGFDIPSYRISFHLRDPDRKNQDHMVEFEGVSAFYFVSHQGERRLDVSMMEYMELSSIHYLADNPDKLIHVSGDPRENVPTYESMPNFYLEIWSAVLLIEANSVTIDGATYSLQSPGQGEPNA